MTARVDWDAVCAYGLATCAVLLLGGMGLLFWYDITRPPPEREGPGNCEKCLGDGVIVRGSGRKQECDWCFGDGWVGRQEDTHDE
jgi:hypothetical protein